MNSGAAHSHIAGLALYMAIFLKQLEPEMSTAEVVASVSTLIMHRLATSSAIRKALAVGCFHPHQLL